MMKLNKKLFFIIILLLSVSSMIAQNNPEEDPAKMENQMRLLTNYEVVSDIDETIFLKIQKDYYMTSDNKAGIINQLLIEEYNEAKESFQAKVVKADTKILEKKESKIEGKNFFYLKIKDNKDGESYLSLVFIKEIENGSIVTLGFCQESQENNYLKLIRKAGLSAKIVKITKD